MRRPLTLTLALAVAVLALGASAAQAWQPWPGRWGGHVAPVLQRPKAPTPPAGAGDTGLFSLAKPSARTVESASRAEGLVCRELQSCQLHRDTAPVCLSLDVGNEAWVCTGAVDGEIRQQSVRCTVRAFTSRAGKLVATRSICLAV